MSTASLIDGRLVGGYSLHEREDPAMCPNGIHRGAWLTIQCGGLAGSGKDIVECTSCGKQRNVWELML